MSQSRPSSTVSFISLPVELQLKILESCLIRPTPLVNFLGRPSPGYGSGYRIDTDRQDPSNIICTNRRFYEEGKKILATQRDLLYTGSCSSPVHVPESLFNHSWSNQIEHLTFLHAGKCTANAASNSISNICYATRHLPSLKSLEINFTDPLQWSEGMSEPFGLCTDAAESPKHVKEIAVAGLDLCQFSWWMVQLLVIHLLSPSGAIGVDFAASGSRYRDVSACDASRRLWSRVANAKLHWMAYGKAYETADVNQAAEPWELFDWLGGR